MQKLSTKHVPKHYYEPLCKNDRFAFAIPIDRVPPQILQARLDGKRTNMYEECFDPFAEDDSVENLTQLIRAVKSAMNKVLTKKQQKAIDLYFFQGKTYQEASRIMGNNSPESVRKLLERAYIRIQKHFKENPELHKLLENCEFRSTKCFAFGVCQANCVNGP